MDTKFVKNITFPSLRQIVRAIPLCKSSADYISYILHLNYGDNGVQVQTSKPVSDDLRATDFPFDALASDIPWLGETMEFYFHDPLIPSLMMGKDKKTGNILVAMEDDQGLYCTLNLPPDMKLDFIRKADAPPMDMATPLSVYETEVLHEMYVLCLKVLAFASIPKYAPGLLSRKEMHQGGKPGVHNRPKRPAYNVIYLPRIIREHEEAAVAEASTQHIFRGRRGTIHRYMSECFVNRQGTWDYFPPIADPITGKYPKLLVKVRKVELV